MQEVEFAGVEVLGEHTAVVRLRAVAAIAKEFSATISIYIGTREAALITIAASARRSIRPITHDLLQSLLEQFDITLESAAITALRNDVFHAHLVVVSKTNRTVIDCRPADAIALALRHHAPVFIDERLLRVDAEATRP